MSTSLQKTPQQDTFREALNGVNGTSKEIRPYLGERIEWHTDGRGGEAIVTSHVRMHDGHPVVRATDRARRVHLVLYPYEYSMADYSNEVARHIRDTQHHIWTVRLLLQAVIEGLEERSRTHDLSKLAEPERSEFARVNDELNALTYGSEEYEEKLEELGPALEHHYSANRHHPEHFDEGMAGMHLVDLLEMAVDWVAAARRHDDGDPHESVEKNQERFGYSDQLASILHNTVDYLQAHE